MAKKLDKLTMAEAIKVVGGSLKVASKMEVRYTTIYRWEVANDLPNAEKIREVCAFFKEHANADPEFLVFGEKA